jgi:hypothetical protein
MKPKVELGDLVEDTITGFKGIAIGRTKWIHGCTRIVIQPQELKDGKPIDPIAFDLPTVRVLSKGAFGETKNTGGPGPNASRRTDPTR